jgi:hypothetical protein
MEGNNSSLFLGRPLKEGVSQKTCQNIDYS